MQEVEEVRITKNDESYSPAIAGAVAAAEAWLKAACAMAKRFPRDMDKVRDKILLECRRPDFARGRYNPETKRFEGGARYSKPVGNSKVKGFSVRFAEAAVQAMGHIHTNIQTLAETDEFRKIEVRVWDSQNMNSFADEATIPKTIERKSIPKERMGDVVRTRHNASGDILYIIRAEEGDLLNVVNAAKSKSFRNSGLRHVPGWLLAECERVIAETSGKEDSRDPEQAKREIFDAFSALGVSVEQIKEYLGHDAAKLEPKEMTELRELYTAIRDGETTMKSVFSAREESAKESNGKGTAGLKERLGVKTISEEQARVLTDAAATSGWKPLEFIAGLSKRFGVDVPGKLKDSQFQEAMTWVNGGTQ